jgi:hypothetical protein
MQQEQAKASYIYTSILLFSLFAAAAVQQFIQIFS